VSFEFAAGGFGALVLGYLCGSIPFGLLLTRWAGTQDLRAIGSGNIGATNVLRTGRRDLAAATLALDALKGTFAVLAAAVVFDASAALSAAVGAFLGHLLPVWLRFKGGKGVFAGVWLIVAFLTRYSSAAALAASLAAPVALLFAFGRPQAAIVFAGLAGVLWFKHRGNIERLMKGTETKIGGKG
jgi:glycerol-3-phosphate acyltransferase PlsY